MWDVKGYLYSIYTTISSWKKENIFEKWINDYEKYSLYKTNEINKKIIEQSYNLLSSTKKDLNDLKEHVVNSTNTYEVLPEKFLIVIIIINIILIICILLIYNLKTWLNNTIINKIFNKIFFTSENLEKYKKDMEESLEKLETLKTNIIESEREQINLLNRGDNDNLNLDEINESLETKFNIKLYHTNDIKKSLTKVLKKNMIFEDFTTKILQLKLLYSHYNRSKLSRELILLNYITCDTSYNDIVDIISNITYAATENDEIEKEFQILLKKIEKKHIEYSAQIIIQEGLEIKCTDLELKWNF